MNRTAIAAILLLFGISSATGQRVSLRGVPTIMLVPGADQYLLSEEMGSSKPFRGLTIVDVEERASYPLLPLFFFERGSSSFSDGYIVSADSTIREQFVESDLQGGTMQKYYRLLDIIGSRLQRIPSATITITGCNSGEARYGENSTLSMQRADLIREYFVKRWGIGSGRIRLLARDLPSIPSSSDDSMGIAENRRVEITSDSYGIMGPVVSIYHRQALRPASLTFTIHNGIADSLVVDRWIEIQRHDTLWYRMKNIGITDTSTEYNWQSREFDEIPIESHPPPYIVTLIVKDISGNEYRSASITIPVRVKKSVQSEHSYRPDSSKSYYSLFLFDFDSDRLSHFTRRIAEEYLYRSITPRSRVNIIGHTDLVGASRHNLLLSQRRAKALEALVRRNCSWHFLRSFGVGEEDPFYPNDLPEGRFYNRTVLIRISTPSRATGTHEG